MSEVTLNMTTANTTRTSSTSIPWINPTSWTYTYTPTFTLAELTERQLNEMEERTARVVRRELERAFALVAQALSEDNGNDDEEDGEDDE